VGEPGSGLHIEGVAVSVPPGGRQDLPEIAYQLVFDHDIRSPWTRMPQFSGSKGLQLPCRGIGFLTVGDTAAAWDCVYDLSFTDGTRQEALVGPASGVAAPGAALEAIRLSLRPRAAGNTPVVDPDEGYGMPPPPGGESPLDDPTIKLRLVSPGFASRPPALRNAGLIPAGSRQAMGASWDRRGFDDRTVSLRVVDNVYAVHEGLVLDRDLAPIPCTRRLYDEAEIAWARDRVQSLRDQGSLRRIGGTSLLCKTRPAANFGHYLVEMFPRAWIGHRLFGSHGLTYLVDQNEVLLVVAESLMGIGISPRAIGWTSNEPVFCERLLLIDGLTYHGEYQSPLCARALRELGEAFPPAPSRKLFVRRRSRDRPLRNEEQVERVLLGRGFSVIEPGRMSLRQQIALFKGASIVVGALGAALTNIAFCASGTRIVALTSASFPDTFFWFLALHRQLAYLEIRGADVNGGDPGAPWNAGFTIGDADLDYLGTL
jgi:hypothetical protein